MYLNTSAFTQYVEIANNGMLEELEYEDDGILMRVLSCKQFDGEGKLRIDKDFQPIIPRPLFLNRLNTPYRLRPGILYEVQMAMKFSEMLPNGIFGIVELSQAAVEAGCLIQSERLNGRNNNFIRILFTPLRRIVMDGMYPLAVLRFVKTDVVLKAKRTDEDEETPADDVEDNAETNDGDTKKSKRNSRTRKSG